MFLDPGIRMLDVFQVTIGAILKIRYPALSIQHQFIIGNNLKQSETADSALLFNVRENYAFHTG